MKIGLDFDNTIICYDQLFHTVALERSLIPADVLQTKDAVRNYLRKIDREADWTELQGIVYGKRIAGAKMFDGVFEFLNSCSAAKIPVFIVSHKTKFPYLGDKDDLHEAAMGWLELVGFFDSQRGNLPRENVFLECSKAEKIGRIKQLGCSHFLDDLPEFLSEKEFPGSVERILFDPNNQHENSGFTKVSSWNDLLELFKKELG